MSTNKGQPLRRRRDQKPPPRDRRDYDREQHAGTFPGCEITGDGLRFMMALDRYKRRNDRPHPTWAEVLAVAVAMGWRKVAAPADLPKYRRAE